ncbi:Hypothetical predicted protein [Paramuricea clavata]|uniref:Uncharacterized protein n=1 Tax=Paramuricea clavata TaxID=317549 RepID=A0A7D9DXP7_PARCT|nr:Hypothetical predicted protein [Paramuricea clavata]
MDGGYNSEEFCKGKSESKLNYKRGKPPDKRRHQLEMSHYTELIQKKEALFKSLYGPKSRKSTSSVHGSRDELLAKLRVLKNEKEEKLKQKQVIDAEIKTLNQQVVKKNETCMKLQANVKYKDEQRTNNAIKNLERHLNTHQLKLSEEKKLVSEIDALKRSKKTLNEYLSAKQEVDQLRQRQSRLRNERDILIRETHDIKARENDVKVSLDSLKEENMEKGSEETKPVIDREVLKKEIDSLYEQRRELHECHKQALANYREEQKQIEKERQQMKAEQRRNETRLTKITAERARQDKRHMPTHKPHEGENVSVCVCLIQYLEPLIVQCSCDDEVDGRKSPRYLDVPKCDAIIPEEGSFAMKPDDNLGGLFVPSNRRMTRKGSRKGRKSKDFSQKLVLHPHVFEQFLKLNLEPPSTYADIIGILEKLREKKDFYERESSKSNQPPLAVNSENLTSKATEKKDVRLDDGLPSQNIREQTANEATKVQDGMEDSKHGIVEVEHEIAKIEHEVDEVQHQAVKDEHETEQTKQTEPEVDQPLHEAEQAEHETEQTEHDSDQTQHESEHAEHENELKEHEVIKNLDEKEKLVHKDVDDKEMDVFKNERSCCKGEEIAAENMLNKTEGKEINELSCNEDSNKDVLNSLKRSSIITDTLEKGMDSIHIKESSPEIQVRVT